VSGLTKARARRIAERAAATLDATTLLTSTIALLLVVLRSMRIKCVLNHVVSVVVNNTMF